MHNSQERYQAAQKLLSTINIEIPEPPEGKFEIYCDASWRDGVAGLSAIIQNESGVIGALSARVDAVDVIEAEFKALCVAVNWLEGHKIPAERVKLFTDNKTVMNMLTYEIPVIINYRPFVERLWRYKKPLPVKWVKREENKLADALAVIVRGI